MKLSFQDPDSVVPNGTRSPSHSTLSRVLTLPLIPCLFVLYPFSPAASLSYDQPSPKHWLGGVRKSRLQTAPYNKTEYHSEYFTCRVARTQTRLATIPIETLYPVYNLVVISDSSALLFLCTQEIYFRE